MPTTEYGIPSTRKDLFNQKVLGQLLPNPIVYKGITNNATPTELFIGGVSGVSTDRNRVYVPEDAAIVGDFTCVAINITTGALVYHATGFISINNDGGTTAVGTVTAKTEHTDVGTAYDIAFTADNTNDALICTVTGVGSTNVFWTVSCRLTGVSVRSQLPYGDS